MKKYYIALALLSGLTIGCHAQVAPHGHTVTESWKAPVASSTWAGCSTDAPCSYLVSRYTSASAITTCPAPNITTPNYTPLNQNSPVTTLSYTDTTATGQNVCYIVQTEQGIAISAPSNTDGPYTVPGNPTPSATLSGTVN